MIRLFVLLGLLAVLGAAERPPAEIYPEGQDFRTTVQHIRQHAKAWMDQAEPDRGKQVYWDLWDALVADFPRQGRRWRELLPGKLERPWLLGEDKRLAAIEQKALGKAVADLEASGVLPDAIITLLTEQNDNDADSIARIVRFARLAHCQDLLGLLDGDPRWLLERQQAIGVSVVDLQSVIVERDQQLAALQQSLVQESPLPAAAIQAAAPRWQAMRARSAAQLLLAQGLREVVFATRTPGRDWHWYANFGYKCSDPSEKYYSAGGGGLWRLRLADNAVTALVDDPDGAVRDPVVHYDGDTILFSWRPAETETYHLYRMSAQGGEPQQLTDGVFDDIEPCWLPDGDVAFISARARRYVPCFHSPVGLLYRMHADGSGIRQLSASMDTENTPWVMPDGRLLFLRWDYIERSFINYHHLWTMNPDGSAPTVYFGNMNKVEGATIADAKPIPGTREVIATYGKYHGHTDHRGNLAVITPDLGPDHDASAQVITPGRKYSSAARWVDPYPLPGGLVLAGRDDGLYLLDLSGREQLLYQLPDAGEVGLHEPRPLVVREREPVIPDQFDPSGDTGTMILADVHLGRNMPRDTANPIRSLRVYEVLPMPISVNFSQDNIGATTMFHLTQPLGRVPVEADGSAAFELPANRAVFFVACDAQGRAVKRMASSVSVMPGEVTSCVGCHEQRTRTPATSLRNLQATQRPVSPLEAIHGVDGIIDYRRDVQPILDRHCVSCHNDRDYAGRLILDNHRGPVHTRSYSFLMWRHLVQVSQSYEGNRDPGSDGSGASPLIQTLDAGHHGVQLAVAERERLLTWIDGGAQHAGSYAALGRGNVSTFPRPGSGHLDVDRGVLQRRCGACHGQDQANESLQIKRWLKERDGIGNRGLYAFDLSLPDRSLLVLAPLASEAGGLERCPGPVFTDVGDADYRALLASIQAAAQLLAETGRYDQPHFIPHEAYIREMQRYGVLDPDWQAGGLTDWYAVDQRYADLFRAKPSGN